MVELHHLLVLHEVQSWKFLIYVREIFLIFVPLKLVSGFLLLEIPFFGLGRFLTLAAAFVLGPFL